MSVAVSSPNSVDVTGSISFTTPQEIIISQSDDSIVVYGKEDGTGTNRAINTSTTGQVRTEVTNVVHIDDNSGSLTVDGSVTVTQATGTNLHAVIDSGTVTTITNVVHVDDNAGSLTVDGSVSAIQSGTWNITNVSGTVSLPTGASTAALQTQPGVDIGDVTINNASGGSAVNIQDGGNSITVDGSITVTQATGTNLHAVIDSGTISTITNVIHVDDNSGSLTIDGAVTVATGFSSGSNTLPNATTTSSTVLAANPNRKYAYINNQSGSTIYIKLGAAAVVGQGIKLVNDSKYEITRDNLWLGTVNAITNAGTHALDIFEGT